MSEAHSSTPSHDISDASLTLAIIDQSHAAREYARDEADARLTAEQNESGKLKRVFKRIWLGNFAHDYYRQKYIREAEKEIVESQNVLVHETDASASERAQVATIRRFQSEYVEAVHDEAGERRQEIDIDSEIADALKGIIRRYANGDIDDVALREEKTRAIAAFRATHDSELLGQGRVSIDNTLAIAQAVKGAVEHGESLDRVMEGMKVISGEARSGVRTEAKLGYNTVDKVIDKVNNSRIGSLVQPEIVVTAAAITASVLRMGSKSVTGALVRTVTFGTIGGVWAGLRENKRMKDERGQHVREMAQGKEYDPSAGRREEMEQTRYETAAASELAEALQSRFAPESLETNDALQLALNQLSAVEARVHLSDTRKIDLITYSAPEAVEEERWALDIARAQAKTTLNHRLDPDVRRALGLDEMASLDEILRAQSEMFVGYTENDITAKDSEFKRIKNRAVRNAAVKGAVFGLVGGMIAQEAMAALSDTRTGVVEELWNAHNEQFNGMQHQTVLYGLLHGNHASHTVTGVGHHDVQTGVHTVSHTVGYENQDVSHHFGASSTYEDYNIGDHGHISISSDHSVHVNNDGTISILDPNGNATIDHLAVNSDGSLPQGSIDILHDHGMTVASHTDTIDSTTPGTQTVSLDEYMTNHQDSTLQIQRDGYYFNGTPPDCVGPNSNLNELGLGWGGTDGTGITPDGGYQMSVASMTHDGSFQGGNSVDWQEAARTGHLRLLVTPSYGTQTVPIDLPVNADGTIDIAPGSTAAQFFSVQDGHAVIDAQFVEVAQVTDVDASGVTHVAILATAPGTGGVTELQDTVISHENISVSNYTITTNGYDGTISQSVPIVFNETVPTIENLPYETSTTVSEPAFTEMAPVIPIVPRRPLETVSRRERMMALRSGYPGETYGHSSKSWEEIQAGWAEQRSPRLNADPSARLRPKEELDYLHDLIVKGGGGHIEAIDRSIDASDVLRTMSGDTRAVVAIPVAAAFEADNIYKTLSLYAQQDDEAKRRSVILMNLNWKEEAEKDPTLSANIERTKQEIERAKRDFPDLQIATIERVWPTDWVENTRNGKIYGAVIKSTYDTAAMAVRRSMEEGRLSPDQDVVLITNDADARGMNRHYLSRYIDAEHEKRDADAFVGAIRWGTADTAQDYPGFHISQLFMESMNMASGRKSSKMAPATIGPNSAFRMSTYAAIGGVADRDDAGAGADSDLGRQVSAARGNFEWHRGSGYEARDGYRSAGGFNGVTGTSTGAPVPPRSRPIQAITGVDIDSSPERLLDKGYRMERFMAHAWNGFDSGQTRDAPNAGGLIEPEDVNKDMDAIKSRVEHQISRFITEWFPEPGVASFVLSLYFPDVHWGKARRKSWKLDKKDSGYEFTFTKTGVHQLQKQLKRDPLGPRLRRTLDGVANAKGVRVRREPAFVRPL